MKNNEILFILVLHKMMNIDIIKTNKDKLILLIEISILFLLVIITTGALPSQGDLQQENDIITLTILQYIFTSIPQLLIIIYIIWLKKDVSLKNFGLKAVTRKDLLYAIGTALFLFLIIYIISFLYALIKPFIPESFYDIIKPETKLNFQDSASIPLLVIFCVVIGYKEELFFRAYLLTRFKQLGLPLYLSIILGALIFGSLHIYEGILGFFFAAVSGVFFSIIYVKFRSLHSIALGHALFNIAMLLLSRFLNTGY